MRASKTIPSRIAGFLAALALVIAGCDSDSPTGPVQQQVPPPTGNQAASATWNITVTTSATSIDLNAGSATLQVQVTARRADNNQLVAPDTTALLSTTSGTLTADAGTAASIPITFDQGGVARATLVTGTQIAEGVIIVRAQIEQSIGSTQIQVIDIAPEAFQITDVSPSVGPPSGGTSLTISGTGFVSPVRVSMTVLGQTLFLENVNVSSSSRITARTPSINLPSGQNAVASVTVENAFDETGNPTATDSLPGAFTFTRSSSGTTTLKLISLSPTFGPNEGGTQVSVIGEGFGNQVQVYFTNGPLIEANVLSVSSTRLEVVTPAAIGPNAGNADSTVSLRVVDPVSGQSDTLSNAFQYGAGPIFISAISPGQDEYLGGTLVTIFGQGFDEPVAVSMGGVGQQIIAVTGTEVVVRTVPVSIGCSDQNGQVSLVNIETNQGATGPNFTYVPIQPVLIGVTPSSGPDGGGNTIDIDGVARSFGLGFDPPIRVTVDGVPTGTVTIIDADTIRTTVPAFTGNYATQSCGDGGSEQLPASVVVRVENLNTGCNDSLTNAYTYIPPTSGCVEPLSADFTFTDGDGVAATLDVDFTDLSSGNIISWDWNFDDGTTSSSQSPQDKVYAVAGTYTVTLTISDGSDTDTASMDVTVPLLP